MLPTNSIISPAWPQGVHHQEFFSVLLPKHIPAPFFCQILMSSVYPHYFPNLRTPSGQAALNLGRMPYTSIGTYVFVECMVKISLFPLSVIVKRDSKDDKQETTRKAANGFILQWNIHNNFYQFH